MALVRSLFMFVSVSQTEMLEFIWICPCETLFEISSETLET